MEKWDKIQWGILLDFGTHAPNLLLSTLWLRPMPAGSYQGEPMRPLLFTTRAEARVAAKEISKRRPKKLKFRVAKIRERYIHVE